MPQVKLIHQPPSMQAAVITDVSAEGCGGYMNNLPFKGQWPGRKGRKTHINLLKPRDSLESISTGQMGDQEEWSLLPDIQYSSSVLSEEGGQDSLQGNEWSCEKILVYLPQGWSDSLSRVPERCSEYQRRYPIMREGSLEWSPGTPAHWRLFKSWRNLVEDLFASKKTFKMLQCFRADLSNMKALGRDALQVEWSGDVRYAFLYQNIIQLFFLYFSVIKLGDVQKSKFVDLFSMLTSWGPLNLLALCRYVGISCVVFCVTKMIDGTVCVQLMGLTKNIDSCNLQLTLESLG